MKLTALEIKGFKSFADKTVINFNDNITGIVGPNGCGKSNVVDSIRWVLGEQKTSMLRLEKMDNLIFNGTKKRKASGLAEVSLTFENTKNLLATEYKSITISRKLFRTGESEYRLNDVPCRLKDITNLFLDTGISSDSYAIIELGMVDEILNDRDNSRRRLFEQAAGISKYKRRKRETLLKLKGTEEDLERVQDLLYEIEGNLKSLESQARRAERYYEIKDEYQEKSVVLARIQVAGLSEKYKSIKGKLEEQDDKKNSIDSQIASMEADLEKQKLDALEKEKGLAEIQKRLNQLTGGVSEKENQRNLLREQIKFQEEKKDQANRSIQDGKDQIQQLELDIERLEKNKAEQEEKIKGIRVQLDELQTELEKVRNESDSLRSALETDRQSFNTAERSIFDLEKKLAINKADLENREREIQQNIAENQLKIEDLSKLETEKKGIDKTVKERKTELDALRKEQEKVRSKISSIKEEQKVLERDLSRENRILDSKKNEFNLTKSLVDNLEGFPESIKYLKKHAEWTKEAPLLSDLIYCSEEYRVAIENLLEPYLNYYVVKNLEEASKAVNLLSDASKGRANFFILDEFRHYEAETPLLLENATPATEVVELDDNYKKLGAYLLDQVYILEDPALLVSDKYFEVVGSKGKGIRLLSKEGKYIRSGFSLSGGAVGLFEGKRIGRAKNLQKLEKEIEKLEAKTGKMSNRVKDLDIQAKDWQGKSNPHQVEDLQRELNKLEQEAVGINSRVDSSKGLISSNEDKNARIREDIDRISNENKDIDKQLVDLRKQKDAAQKKLESVDSAYSSISEDVSRKSAAFNEQNIVFHQQDNLLKQVDQELSFKQNQIQQNQKSLEDNGKLIEESEQKLQEARQNLKQTEEDLLQGYDDKENFGKEVEGAEQAFYTIRESINALETKIREVNRSGNQVQTAQQDLNQQMNEVKIELNTLRERLSIEFKVNINKIINEPAPEVEDVEALREKVEKLKKRLENYGEINPMAMEAYEEMKKRYDFIQSQKTDLEEAKTSLLTTIDEIEEMAKTQFLDAFHKIREHFIRVFRTLFTEEDQCDLILLNEDSPLESKIDIIAKPKGKRPQIIDQLSGGEKTLTATALLFSLYLLKPAPFCVFDEVDAPLDDANISKFNNIIREFSKDSQFIIVTHNKQTMSHVDVIYGVTMAEPGVSKVVPVDLRDLK